MAIVVAHACPIEAHGNEGYAFFEKSVRPVLVERCYSCYSEEAEKPQGGLWLDRKEGWSVGGDS